MSPINILSDFIQWACVFIASGYLIINRKNFKEDFWALSSIILFALIIIVIQAIYYHMVGVAFTVLLGVIQSNLLALVKNTILGLAGLSLFRRKVESDYNLVVQGIAEHFSIKLKYISLGTFGNVLFSFIIVKIFAVNFIDQGYLNELIMSCFGAICEEMAVRIFVLGGILFLFRQSEYCWEFAILVSTGYWTLLHFNGTAQDYVRIIQIFPLGCTLGYLLKHYGYRVSLYTHLFYNIICTTIFSI